MTKEQEIHNQTLMEEQFVTYRIANMLSKIGFNHSCFAYFSDWGTQEPFLISCEYGQEKESCKIRRKNYLCSAPTWKQAIDFCLKNHNMGLHYNQNVVLMEKELFDLVEYIYNVENGLFYFLKS